MESMPIIPAPVQSKEPASPFFGSSFAYVSHWTNGGISIDINNLPFAIADGTFVGFHFTGSQVNRTVGSMRYTIYPKGALSGYDPNVVYVVINITYPGDVWLFEVADKLWK